MANRRKPEVEDKAQPQAAAVQQEPDVSYQTEARYQPPKLPERRPTETQDQYDARARDFVSRYENDPDYKVIVFRRIDWPNGRMTERTLTIKERCKYSEYRDSIAADPAAAWEAVSKASGGEEPETE